MSALKQNTVEVKTKHKNALGAKILFERGGGKNKGFLVCMG